MTDNNSSQRDMINEIRILIIDDQTTMRKIIRQLLFRIGKFNITEAANGLEAMKLLNVVSSKNNPDVIISDLHMAGMDGIELCNKIRLSKNPAVRDIPVLILTGEQDDFILKVSKQVGTHKILSKPIGTTELRDNISSALGYQI